MPRVASEPSVLLAPHHNPGARHRSAGGDSGEPSSHFAQLLDSADTPKAPERSNRAGRASSTDASEQRPRPPEGPDRTNDRTADASESPSPEPTDAQPAEQTSAGAIASDVPKVEHAKDDTEPVDASTATVDNTDTTNVTLPAPAPPGTVVPASAELVLATQGGGDDVAIESDVATSVPASAAIPKVPLPEPPVPSPGNEAAPSGEAAQSQAQPTDANEAVAPLAELLTGATGTEQTTPPDTGKLPADGRAPEVPTPTAQPDKALATDAQAAQGAQIAQAEQDGKDAPGAKTTTTAAATDAGKPRPKAGPQSVEGDESQSTATTSAANTDKPADASGPESKEHAADEPHHPHQHADTGKPDDQQPLGLQVSDAAHNAKPPSDAVHVVLQAPDQAGGTLAQPATTTAQATTAATPDAAVPIAGLAVEIASRAQAGSNHFDIRLDPPELGRIDVRLDIDSSGQVTSRLVVDRAETLEHLRRDAGDLERALQQAGLKTSQDGLQFSLRDQGFAGRDGNNPSPNAARLVVPDPDLAPPVDALVTSYGRMVRTGGIDISI